jgi:hypothetical protein
LHLGSVLAMVPAEGRCSVILAGGSAAQAAVPGVGAGTPGAGAKVGQLGAECCHLAREDLDPLQKCVDVGDGATLVSASWNVALMMRSAQQAAASKSPLGWPVRMTCMLGVANWTRCCEGSCPARLGRGLRCL